MDPRRCPECDGVVGPGYMNVREDAVLCPACGTLARLSMTIEDRLAARLDAAAEAVPPPGCEIARHGSAIDLVSRSGNREGRLFILCSLVWLVMCIGLIGLAGAAITLYLGGPVPFWLRSFLGQAAARAINGRDVAVFAGLAGAFSLMGVVLLIVQRTGHFGPVRISASSTEISIRAGFGWLGLNRRIRLEQVRSVSIGPSSLRVRDGRRFPALIIRTDERLELGALTPPAACEWLAGVLRWHLLAVRRPGKD
ncbi:MAG: hypothetical protein IT436_15740 [Phycisphaerales bacterium]|nr:hypothetical protein [Phycisphaerales bacterium]